MVEKKYGRNDDIRRAIHSSGHFLWEVAEEMGISEPTMTRWMHGRMTAERRSAILGALDRLRNRED